MNSCRLKPCRTLYSVFAVVTNVISNEKLYTTKSYTMSVWTACLSRKRAIILFSFCCNYVRDVNSRIVPIMSAVDTRTQNATSWKRKFSFSQDFNRSKSPAIDNVHPVSESSTITLCGRKVGNFSSVIHFNLKRPLEDKRKPHTSVLRLFQSICHRIFFFAI